MSHPSQHSSTEPEEEHPGAYPIPFSTVFVELGSRLDSIPPSTRYWAVNPNRAHMHWDVVAANKRYEDWLCTQPPGEYPVPFQPAEGKRLDEIEDNLRYWGVHPDRSSSPWYNFFKRANDRYEAHLATTREPGEFAFPWGYYKGIPIKNVPQDEVWWTLRPSNYQRGWYKPMYDANNHMLDDVYKSRSPGSELIWFGTRYKGIRLDQVYERKGFIRWCLDPQRKESGWCYRLKDLIERLEEWRRLHPERGGPRQRRKAPDIQNPVGEPIGPWDDSLGSADEDDSDYDNDSFIQSDNEEPEYETDSDELMDYSGADNDDSEDSDESTSSNMEVRPSGRDLHKRRRANIIQSDEEENDMFVRKLGKRYRIQCDDSSEE